MKNKNINKKLIGITTTIVAFFVMIVTFYVLILPAITMTPTPICGNETHAHTQDCFKEKVNITYVCTEKEHTHSNLCYNEEKILICEISEEHVHDETCYGVKNILICGNSEEHTHNASCYNTEKILNCETEEHSHNNECYDAEGNIICEKEEHSHKETCYSEKESLTCGKNEHIHEDICYSKEETLICEKVEHTHNDACYDKKQTLICNEKEHTHNVECITVELVDNGFVFGLNSSEESINSLTAKEVEEEYIDFTEWITGVNLKSSYDGINFNDNPEHIFEIGQFIRFETEYAVPGNALSFQKNKIKYVIPANISIKQEVSGHVYNASGEIVGEYVISEFGQVVITFNDKFVALNMEGHEIIGSFFFDAEIEGIETKKDGSATFIFNSTVSVDIIIPSKSDTTGDLFVEKSQGQISEDKTIKYTIKVYSNEGTNDEISLNDTMTNVLYNGDIKVTDNNNNVITVTQPEQDTQNFDITLPKLSEGGFYLIEYTAKFADDFTQTTNLSNSVKVTSKDKDDMKIEASAWISQIYSVNLISKDGTVNGDNIEWTITVNSDKTNLKGFVLTDEFNGMAYTGEITVVKDGGEPYTTTFPIEFLEDDTSTYIITYTTPKDTQFGSNTINNRAKLEINNKIYSSDKSIWIGETNYQYITKVFKEVEYTDDQNGVATWDFTINAETDIPAPVKFGDYLNGNQYFTSEQMKFIIDYFDSLNINYSISMRDSSWQTYTSPDDAEQFIAFEIIINETIPRGTVYTLEYDSTVYVPDITQKYNYSNKIELGNYSAQAEFDYTPIVQKYDPNSNENPSTHEYTDGLLYWNIDIFVPGEEFKVEELLPETLLLEKITVNGQEIIEGDNDYNGLVIRNENILEFKQSFIDNYQGQKITINVCTKINDNLDWTSENSEIVSKFDNSVVVRKNDGTELGRSTHSQTIKKTAEKKDEIIKKTTSVENNAKTDLLPFYVEINKEKKNLLEDIDILEAEDCFTYQGCYNNLVISLVPNSVKAYEILDDGTKRELTSDEFMYKYEYEVANTDYSSDCYNKLSFKFPDEMHIELEYSYKIYGTENSYIWGLNNTIALKDVDMAGSSAITNFTVQILQSGATANVAGVTIIKSDKDNHAIKLKGVKFQLYEYNGQDYEFLSSHETNGVGEISIKELKYNTAYKLIETETLVGYKLTDPIYFYIINEDEEAYPLNIPDTFNGQKLRNGQPLEIANEAPKTNISIKKIWKDSNGIETDEHPEYIEVKLYRYVIPDDVFDEEESKDGVSNLNIKYGSSIWNIWNEENNSYTSGSKIRLTVDYDPEWGTYYGFAPVVTFNNTQLYDLTDDKVLTDGLTFTYEFTVSSSQSSLFIETGTWNDNQCWNFNVEVIEEGSSSSKDQYLSSVAYKTIILNGDNDWQCTISDLPLLGIDDSGNLVHYEYTVKETDISGYSKYILKEYDSENNEYLFTITNKRTNDDNCELPATGGPTVHLYYLIGIICFIFVIFSIKKRNKKS